MIVKQTISGQFNCSLERAFKAPILGHATQFMAAYRLQPAIIDFEDDATWGQIGGIRYPISAGTFLVKKGRILKDEILERKENEYWKWTIYNFKTKTLFFTSKAIGEWSVKQVSPSIIDVTYTYSYHAKNKLLQPLTWCFVKFQILGFMKHVIAGIKIQAESNEHFFYKD